MPKYKHGSGRIYQRGKTWWMDYYHDGERIRESAVTRDRGEARRLLQQRLGQIAEGRFSGPAADHVTVDELLAGLLTEYEVNERRSIRSVRIKVEKHLLPFFGGRGAHAVSAGDVDNFITTRKEAGASNGEINREVAALKRAYNLGLQSEKIIRKPHFPHLEENNAREGFFETWEFEAILPRLPEHLRPPLTFAFYTGWRVRSEILSLAWDRVDLEAQAVRLYRGSTKNKDGRLVRLPQVLMAILEAQWQEHRHLFPLVTGCSIGRENRSSRSTRHGTGRALRQGSLRREFPTTFGGLPCGT